MNALPLLTILIISLASISFFTLLERNILGYSQLRNAPNKVGPIGLIQPAGDGGKLFTNETLLINKSNNSTFLITPILSLFLACSFWLLIPTTNNIIYFNFSLVVFLCISCLSVYPTLLAGWASNSNYSLVGAQRSVAQTISYEISIALILISALISLNSLNITEIVNNLNSSSIIASIPLLALIWYSTSVAETNRSPYDLPEGESELVSGFNTEYGGTEFALIFIAEYLNIIFISIITSLLLCQHTTYPWTLLFIYNTLIISLIFINIRASYPRLRYDRLIALTWTSYLPASLFIIIIAFTI